MNIRNFALQMGELGEHHYRKLAGQTPAAAVRAIFTSIAIDQNALCRSVAAMRAGSDAAGCADFATLRAEKMLRRALVRMPKRQLKNEAEAGRYALRVSLRLVNMLDRLARTETDLSAKGGLQMLADEERRLSREIRGLMEFMLEGRWYPTSIEYAMTLDRQEHP